MEVNYQVVPERGLQGGLAQAARASRTCIEASARPRSCAATSRSQNALESIQIHGGYGYLRDFAAERALRDSKLASIGGGTTEIQKMIISRTLLG